MPNKQYNRGAAFERRVVKDRTERGRLAVRAAGSHGPFDVWAWDGHTVVFIQCKINGKWSKKDREAARKSAGPLATILLASRAGRKLVYQLLMLGGKLVDTLR